MHYLLPLLELMSNFAYLIMIKSFIVLFCVILDLLMVIWFHLSAPLTSSPVWARDFSSSEELITEFCRECRIVRKGIAIATLYFREP